MTYCWNSMTFPRLSMTTVIFHDFSGLENLNFKTFHDFQGCVGTLKCSKNNKINVSSKTVKFLQLMPSML